MSSLSIYQKKGDFLNLSPIVPCLGTSLSVHFYCPFSNFPCSSPAAPLHCLETCPMSLLVLFLLFQMASLSILYHFFSYYQIFILFPGSA